MSYPTSHPVLTEINSETVELILRDIHLFLEDGLTGPEEGAFIDDAADLAARCRTALLTSFRDTQSHHRAVFLIVWAFARLVDMPSDELACEIGKIAGAPTVDETMLQTMERKCMLAWLENERFDIPYTRPPSCLPEHELVRTVLATGLDSLLKPDPIELFHRSQCAMKMSRATRLQAGDDDGVAFMMGQEPDADLRDWLFDQLLHVSTSDLHAMLFQSNPLAIWVGLIGILMMRQVNQVTYAIDTHLIRPITTPITVWMLPAKSQVGVRMNNHSWAAKLESTAVFDLAHVVLLHGDNTRALVDRFN